MANQPKHKAPEGMEPYDLGGKSDLGALSTEQQEKLNQFKVRIWLGGGKGSRGSDACITPAKPVAESVPMCCIPLQEINGNIAGPFTEFLVYEQFPYSVTDKDI